MITLKLPMPPSVNALYRNVPKVGRVKTQRYLTWFRAASNELRAQRPKKVRGEYVMTIFVERPDRRKRDLFNLPKAIEDLLVAHGVVEDDHLVVDGRVVWAGEGKGGCTVQVSPAQPIAMARAA